MVPFAGRSDVNGQAHIVIGGIYGYLVVAILVAGTLGATYFKGRSAGADACRVEWAQANAAALAKAEADRQRQDELSRAEAARLETALAKQRKVNAELLNVVEAHIKAARLPSECRITPELVRDWNAAGNPAAKDAAGRVVPGVGGAVAPADGPEHGRDAAKPPRGG